MSTRAALNQPALDFELADFKGNTVRLSGFRGERNILLVSNRGFY